MATIRKRNGLWQVQVRRKSSPHIAKSFRSKSDADAWARRPRMAGAALTTRKKAGKITRDAKKWKLAFCAGHATDQKTGAKR